MFFVWKREGKRPLSRLRRRWEDNIRGNFREMESKTVSWVHLAQDRNIWLSAVNPVMIFGLIKLWGIS
jgi:hypothetical protein